MRLAPLRHRQHPEQEVRPRDQAGACRNAFDSRHFLFFTFVRQPQTSARGSHRLVISSKTYDFISSSPLKPHTWKSSFFFSPPLTYFLRYMSNP